MLPPKLLIMIVIAFLTSIISVVTGSTSLITVPAMIQLGIEPHVAVATNMFALIFLSMGGSLPFARRGAVSRSRLPQMITLTIAGSAIGALLLLRVPERLLQLVIAIVMIGVAVFSLVKKDIGTSQKNAAPMENLIGYALTFLLAIYGGFFSGGYVTMLTAVFVVFFGMTFLASIATTKVMNVFSSLIATGIFMLHGVVDYKLGIILGVTMFVGALAGGHLTLKLSAAWLRRIFVAAILVLSLNMLLRHF